MADDICYPDQSWINYRGNEKRHMAGEVEQTHHDGCWRDPAHHACAVAEIERLLKRKDELLLEVGRADAVAVDYQAALATARAEALEAARWLEMEDMERDPDDLYTGRWHRAAAIRTLKDRRP